MQKGPLSQERRAIHAERVRAGQALARAVGKLGRPRRYTDAMIREAMRRHESGETWAATAAALSISLETLYARVRKLRRARWT